MWSRINLSTKVSKVAQKILVVLSSNGPPRNDCGVLEANLKTCAKWTKLRVYRASKFVSLLKSTSASLNTLVRKRS